VAPPGASSLSEDDLIDLLLRHDSTQSVHGQRSPADVVRLRDPGVQAMRRQIIEDARLGLPQLVRLATDTQGWQVVHRKGSLVVSEKQCEPLSLFRSEMVIGAPPLVVLDYFWDHERKFNIDVLFRGRENIEFVGYHTALEHQFYLSAPFVSPREMLMLAHWCRLTDGSYVMNGRSPTFPFEWPVRKGYLRGRILTAGALIQPMPGNPNATKLILLAQSDLCGEVPKFIARKANYLQYMQLTALEKEVRRMGQQTTPTMPHLLRTADELPPTDIAKIEAKIARNAMHT